ncbi:MAG: DUF4190 domain-containing protein [bacterium]|nr:DUF4190 domain-containing protein [bacterium]
MTPPTEGNPPDTPSPAPAAPASAPSGAPNPADNTKAIITLVLGILSLICCGFFAGIPAIFVGRSELKAIDEGRSSESNRNMAKIGFILGIVGTILSALGTIAYIGIIVLAIVTGSQSPSSF